MQLINHQKSPAITLQKNHTFSPVFTAAHMMPLVKKKDALLDLPTCLEVGEKQVCHHMASAGHQILYVATAAHRSTGWTERFPDR